MFSTSQLRVGLHARLSTSVQLQLPTNNASCSKIAFLFLGCAIGIRHVAAMAFLFLLESRLEIRVWNHGITIEGYME
jgi:hypothetical protein